VVVVVDDVNVENCIVQVVWSLRQQKAEERLK
jgi:hypothetical protein